MWDEWNCVVVWTFFGIAFLWDWNENWSFPVLWPLLLELTPKKYVFFIIGDWNEKIGSQEISGITRKFGLGVWNEAGLRLSEFCQENASWCHSKHPLPTKQDKRRLYTWTSPDGQYCNQIDYILFSPRWRNSIQSAKERLGADCCSEYEHIIAKFRLKLRNVGKPLDHLGMT